MKKPTSHLSKIALASLALIAAISFASLPTQEAEAHNGGKKFKCFTFYGERIPGLLGKRQARYVRQNGGNCHKKQHWHQPQPVQPVYNNPWPQIDPTYGNGFGQPYGGDIYVSPPNYPTAPAVVHNNHGHGSAKIRKAVRAAKNRYPRLGRFVRAENFSRGGFKYKKFTLVFKKGHKIKRVRVKANAWSGKVKWVNKI
jgi:hypothetical protein